MKFVDSSLFILDQRLNAILEFDRSGKFIRKIPKKKAGPFYEYLQITDFDIDRESGVLYVLIHIPIRLICTILILIS